MGLSSWLKALVPFLAMVVVEILSVGLTTLSKAAMSKGMSPYVFVVYSNALATPIFLPFLIFQRTKRPPLSFSLLCKFFLLSSVGIAMMQNCVIVGVNYSSPTLASAMCSLVPAIAFVLAVFIRMEKLDLRSSKGQIKIVGTILSISGALTVTIYNGPAIVVPQSQSTHNTISAPKLSSSMNPTAASNWIIGGLLLATAYLCLAIWNIAQAVVLKGFPSQKTILFFYYFFGTLQCAIVGFALERDPSAWIITPDIELISVIYSAVFGNAVTYSLLTWCMHKKGPVFVVMFKPLEIAIAAFMSTIFLGDTLYTGSVIGACLIVVGFYGVIWAQSEDGKVENHGVVDESRSPLPSPRTPLLESQSHV
ncbi:Auxin-induced protein 5NG4 [Morus notabilis]|uniref:WAT1-related protein n=2 Tax=Morus notabilis TaxID=981085 RepID=W9SGA5_9ROSA|nr:Auxin-induced protein 5NG4 [Morus notabilis]